MQSQRQQREAEQEQQEKIEREKKTAAMEERRARFAAAGLGPKQPMQPGRSYCLARVVEGKLVCEGGEAESGRPMSEAKWAEGTPKVSEPALESASQ